jgi:hypothetical protein
MTRRVGTHDFVASPDHEPFQIRECLKQSGHEWSTKSDGESHGHKHPGAVQSAQGDVVVATVNLVPFAGDLQPVQD